MKRRAKPKPVGDLLDAQPPSDLEAEQRVLGPIVLDRRQMTQASGLKPGDFWDPAHAIIFAAMQALEATAQPWNETELYEHLSHAGCGDDTALERAGGAAYLAKLGTAGYLAHDVGYYADKVQEKARRRGLIDAGCKLIQAAHNGQAVASAVDGALQELGRLIDLDKNDAPEADGWRPFPVDALPRPVRRFVNEAALSIGCDSSFVALPLLAGLASAVGNTRRIKLKHGWEEPLVVWAAVVGYSGTGKSPAQDAALAPLRQRQAKAFDAHHEALRRHELDKLHFDADKAAWKTAKANSRGPVPVAPERPTCERFIVGDTTAEALAPILENAPRGVLLERDELAGWLGSFDRYSGGKGGADAAHWLSIFGASALLVDRKQAERPTLYVPRAAVSICGGIQPEILRQALGRERFQDGMAARLLLAMPPATPTRWTEAEIGRDAQGGLADVYDRLLSLDFASDDEGKPAPRLVPLTPSGKAAWGAFVERHSQEHSDLAGDLAAAWAKLKSYAARLALLVHLVRHVGDDAELEHRDAIDGASMAAAVTLVEWFKSETRRVYGQFAGTDEDREQARLLEFIERKGAVTA